MGIVIDGIIVIIVLASIFMGYRKGLIALGINLVASIITIVAVMILYRPVGAVIINKTEIDEKIESVIENNINEIVATEEMNDTLEALIHSGEEGVVTNASKAIAENIIYGGAMLVLFVAIRIILIFVTALGNFVAKLPVLEQFNEIGGIAYGLLRGMLIVYALLMLVNLIISVAPDNPLSDLINTSYIAQFMAKYNILSIFIKKS